MLVVVHGEGAGAGVEAQHQAAGGELHAVVVAQDRQQHAVGEVLRGRAPVDVEEVRERGGGAVLQHVLPPCVVGGEHAHVVGHDVHHDRHAVLAQLRHEVGELGLRADLGVERLVVDDVVAVRAAGARAQERRAVDVAHAEAREVGHERGRVAEGELAVQLQAVGGERDARLLEARRALAPGARLAADGRERARHAAQARIARPCVHLEGKLAAPVGMLVDGARQVGLLRHAQHVLHLHHHHRRGRARGVRLHRDRELLGERCRGIGGPGDQSLGAQGVHQRRALARSLGPRALELARVEQPQGIARGEVGAVPPAGERRQVVRGPRHQRAPRIGRRRLECDAVALEEQQAVGEDLVRLELAAQLLGDGAQVLADHEAALAVALERHDAEQVGERVAHVRALARLAPGRNPPQAREPHHVVDAQRSRAQHVGAQRRDERRVGGLAQTPRIVAAAGPSPGRAS